MEKVTKVVENKSWILEFVKDMWHDLMVSFKTDLSEVFIQFITTMSGLYFLAQGKVDLDYQTYIGLSDSFIQNIIPTIIGAGFYSYSIYDKGSKDPSKFVTFLIAISLAAFSTDFFIQAFNQEPSVFYYTVGGATILPTFQAIVGFAIMVKKEGPKAVWDFIKSKFNKTNNQ